MGGSCSSNARQSGASGPRVLAARSREVMERQDGSRSAAISSCGGLKVVGRRNEGERSS